MKRCALVLVFLVAFAAPAGAAKAPSSKATKACTEALAAADHIRELEVEATDNVTALLTAQHAASVNSQAINDGTVVGSLKSATQFITDLTAANSAYTAKTRALTPPTAEASARYDAAAKKCRAGK